MDTEILDILKSIGLNLYERKIFVALLAKGIATAAEVSEIANVPRSRSYDVLESLAEKGFVMVQPSKPIKYVALKPSDAFERVKENLNKKHETVLERLERLKNSEILGKLEQIYQGGFNLIRPSEMTGTLKGKHIIDRHLRSLFKDAKENIKIATTGRGLEELYSKHFRFLKKANRNGVRLQIIAPLNNSDIVKPLSEVAELKNINENFGRFYLVDNRCFLMALTDDDKTHETQDIMFWADSPHAVKYVIGTLFNKEWERE